MNLELSTATEVLLRDAAAGGGYASAADAVEDALRMLRGWQDMNSARLQAAVQAGVEQLDRGEFVEWSDLRDFIRKRLETKNLLPVT
jgi:Arc/MetJ-type ribon-helix-helix transcriptional regulator